ncbi:hypothetical protein D068_cds37750 [Bacillus atrophaeus UCMB-5137]|nr:hypothetical protein D068_cds37750 [Bacillus atrophaeus UCMB-5137]
MLIRCCGVSIQQALSFKTFLLSHFHYKNNSPVLMQINMTVRIFVKEMNT